MTEQKSAAPPDVAAAPAPRRGRRLSLPSACTILFALIVIVAIATWVVPAGVYDTDGSGTPVPRIASGFAGIPISEGLASRLVLLVVSLLIGVIGLIGRMREGEQTGAFVGVAPVLGALTVAVLAVGAVVA